MSEELVRKLCTLVALSAELEDELKAVHKAAIPYDRAYWRAHDACLRAIGGPSGRPGRPLPAIPRPFPFALYEARAAASAAVHPYRQHERQLRARIKDIEASVKTLRAILMANQRGKRNQGELDLT